MSLSISKKISAEYLMKESHDHQQPKSTEIVLYFITKQGIEHIWIESKKIVTIKLSYRLRRRSRTIVFTCSIRTQGKKYDRN